MNRFILEAIETADKRPGAAFFIPKSTDVPNLYYYSEVFYRWHNLLLPAHSGVVFQASTLSDDEMTLGPPSISLIFDARKRNIGRFLWQMTTRLSPTSNRIIKQIEVFDNTVEPPDGQQKIGGTEFVVNPQGSLESTEELCDVDIRDTAGQITSVLQTPEAVSYIEEINKSREHAYKDLTRFILEQTFPLTKIAPDTFVDQPIRIYEPMVESEYRNRLIGSGEIGFVPIFPFDPSYR